MNQFTYHAVGQGLFYSGNIGNNFNFIYDCGSFNKKSLNKSIANYKKNINENEKIDILFISHFHEDHINGLEKLISGYDVKYVIMPYITSYQRLLLLNNSCTENYKSFVINPIEYICKHNIKTKIILIQKTKKPENRNNENLLSLDTIFEKGEIMKKDSEFYFDKSFNNNNVRIIKNGSVVFAQENWIFDVFYKNISDQNILNQIKSVGSKQTILKNANGEIKKIKSILKKQKQNPNENSLILYHSQIKPKKNNSHLLTGDYQMDNDLSYQCFINHFKHYMGYINNISIPHHGGKGWNNNLLIDLPNCKFYTCSYGVKNKYNHPNINVVYDIISGGRYFLPCNQFSEIKINT